MIQGKQPFIIFLLGMFPFYLAAQGSNNTDAGTISGQVNDASTHKPLPYSSVSVYTVPDSTLVSGVITDEKGTFSIEGIPTGTYHLNISFVGYQAKSIEVLVGKLNTYFDVGTIELDAVASQLDEVVVQGQRDIVSSGLDRKVV